MRITRSGFEAVHIPNEVAEEEGPLNPNVLPTKDRIPIDIVPREIGWEYKRTETPGGYVKHVTGQTEHSHPQIVKKYLPAKVSEGFTPPDEKEAEGIVEKRMPGAVKPWAGVSKITLRDVPNKYNPGAVNIKTKGVFLGDKQVGTLDYYPEEGDIAQIEIDEKYQRRGIGREAVWHALNESKTTDAEGNPTHSISGESSLDAQRFWRGIGAGVYRGRFEGPDTLPTISLDRSDFEAVQLKLGKKDLGAKGAPLYPHETYPSEPSVKTPRFMQMDEGRYPKAGSSGGRPYIVDYERPYFDAPSKFRFSINVDDKPVPTDYFGWHPIEVPEKGKGAKGYTTLRRASGERPSPTVQIEPNKDEFYLKRLEKERAHQGELWDRAEAKNKEYRAIGGKTRYMINTDDFPREHYIDVSTHRYTPRAKVDLVGTLAMTDAVFDRKNKVAVPMFLTKVKESPPPGNPRYTHKGGHSSLFGITLFRTQGDKPAESIPIHEVAHQIHGALPEAEKMEWTDIHGASLPSDLPSVYASKNKNEDFAESYVAFVGGKKLDTHRQQFMERIASRYNLPAKENFEERFKVPVEYRAPEMKAEELPDVSEKEPESKITTLARATWLSEHPGLHTAVEQKEKQSSTLPSELIIEPTDEEIPIEEKPAFEFSIESPLGKPVRKSERQPEEESAGYSGSEEEINKEAESLYGGEEGG